MHWIVFIAHATFFHSINGRTQAMKLLVTGGNGFIGRHVCRAAVEAGHQVLAMPGFETSAHTRMRK